MTTEKDVENIELKEENELQDLKVREEKSSKFEDQSWIRKQDTEEAKNVKIPKNVDLDQLIDTVNVNEHQDNYAMLLNIKVDVSVDVGGVNMKLSDLSKISQGTVVETSRFNKNNFTLSINGKWIAEGDIVRKGAIFGFRILKILDQKERLIAMSSLK